MSSSAKPASRQGHKVVYALDSVAGRLTSAYTDPATGTVYPTRALMRKAIARRYTRILSDFRAVIEEGSLGGEPWERLPMESDLQYARFRSYLTLVSPPTPGRRMTRSVARTAAHHRISEDTLRAVAQKYHWVYRAELWDRELDRQADEEFKEARRISARSQAALGAKLQRAASKGADILLTGAVEMSASGVARLAEAGVKIERLAMDKSTDNSATVTRFIYEGQKPAWADSSDVVGPIEQTDAKTGEATAP